MRLNKPLHLISWIVLFEGLGFLLGLMTQTHIYPWYAQLNKSSLTPPGFVFSIAWTVLYGLLAVIAWSLSTENKGISKKITVLFALQMLMNWAWTPLFFGLHYIQLSAIWLIGLVALNVLFIIEARKTNTIISYLTIPYLLWLMYAAYLNGVIALTN